MLQTVRASMPYSIPAKSAPVSPTMYRSWVVPQLHWLVQATELLLYALYCYEWHVFVGLNCFYQCCCWCCCIHDNDIISMLQATGKAAKAPKPKPPAKPAAAPAKGTAKGGAGDQAAAAAALREEEAGLLAAVQAVLSASATDANGAEDRLKVRSV